MDNKPDIKDDPVNHPKHYTQGDIECIDAMIAAKGIDKVIAFCECNAFKYIWRCNEKNGIEDIEKAIWYEKKAIELRKRVVCQPVVIDPQNVPI